jgi:hypothetical protein
MTTVVILSSFKQEYIAIANNIIFSHPDETGVSTWNAIHVLNQGSASNRKKLIVKIFVIGGNLT